MNLTKSDIVLINDFYKMIEETSHVCGDFSQRN